MRIVTILLIMCVQTIAYSQSPKLEANVSNDSILLGHSFVINFTLSDAQTDDIILPDFKEFTIISGPNISSQMSIINGSISQSMSYTFYLEAKGVGDFYIEPASAKVVDDYLETTPILIRVFPNNEGIIQQNPQERRGGNDNLFGNRIFDQSMPSIEFFDQFFDQSLPWAIEPHNPVPQDTLPKVRKRKTTRI